MSASVSGKKATKADVGHKTNPGIAIFKDAIRQGGNPNGQYDCVTPEEKVRALKELEREAKN